MAILLLRFSLIEKTLHKLIYHTKYDIAKFIIDMPDLEFVVRN